MYGNAVHTLADAIAFLFFTEMSSLSYKKATMNYVNTPGALPASVSANNVNASRSRFLAVLLMLIAFLAVSFSTVRNTDSDSRSTLLVSEALLQHGTVKLDHYGREAMANYGYTVHEKNGHFYSYFPIGTSIASLPFVAIANGWGLKMLESHGALQMAIAAFNAALTIFLMIRLAGLFLPATSAVVIAGVFWFGTSLASTDGTALWSHSFAVLFALGALYLSIKVTRLEATRLWPLISACLFMAYLCRPTMALLSPFLLLFIFSYHRAVAIKSAVLLALFLAGLAGFSLHEWGQYLPDYYLPKRLSGNQFSLALYGNLLSPARGLLVYSPFIVLAWLCYRNAQPGWPLKKSWWLIAIAWPVMHWIAISRFPVWAAGWSYGPRFMTDVLPGLFLLTIRTWPVSFALTPHRQMTAALLLAAGCVFAFYANTWQSLFNPYAARWNMQPDIGVHPEYLFDWRYPQFLHNKERHEARSNHETGQFNFVQLDFDGSWIRKDDAGMSGPYAMMSNAPQGQFKFTATGCFDLGMLKHAWSGIALVSRDGVPIREIDLYEQETSRTFKAFFEQDSAPHEYIVQVTGKKNPASGGYEIWVDGVIARPECP